MFGAASGIIAKLIQESPKDPSLIFDILGSVLVLTAVFSRWGYFV